MIVDMQALCLVKDDEISYQDYLELCLASPLLSFQKVNMMQYNNKWKSTPFDSKPPDGFTTHLLPMRQTSPPKESE